MEHKEIPSGLGKPVRPLIRLFAAFIGLVGLFGLGSYAFLFYAGAPDIRFEFKTVAVLSQFALAAAYGIGIGVSGKAPKGVLPWK